jgi:hypothetical protein
MDGSKARLQEAVTVITAISVVASTNCGASGLADLGRWVDR